MTGRPRPRRTRRPATADQAASLLDWRDSTHWSGQPKPCRYCGFPTHLRDSRRSPAHKTCAEDALAQQAADAADAYRKDTL
ncbi:hypothetical protein AB0B07_09425 [Streptomyces sioyaensis]|uniref:hypothetical protein n=1 Tax=Streptomyces sioyaensis TaxID=67364 RepID=UPI0033F496F3